MGGCGRNEVVSCDGGWWWERVSTRWMEPPSSKVAGPGSVRIASASLEWASESREKCWGEAQHTREKGAHWVMAHESPVMLMRSVAPHTLETRLDA